MTQPYDTSSSSSCKGGIEDNMLGNFCVSLMEHSFLHKGLEYLDITFAALYLNVPVWSMIGRNFRFATEMSRKVSNLWVLAVS